MNKRRIQERLIKVHREWVESISDREVRQLAKEGSLITGGCIPSLLLNEEPKDYDIYFRDRDTTLAITNYYAEIINVKAGYKAVVVMDGAAYREALDKQAREEDNDGPWWLGQTTYNMTTDRIRLFIKSSGVIRELEKPVESDSSSDKKKKKTPEPFRPVFASSNAITLSDKIQIINRFYGEPKTIHKTFDFVHCFNYWDSKTQELVLNVDSLEAILDKRLVYRGSHYPLCSIVRLRKFLKRGWTINAGQILKMCFQLSQLNLSDIAVLEDQLIGVDTAYFQGLIFRIQQELFENSEFVIEESYVMKLVEEIFGE